MINYAKYLLLIAAIGAASSSPAIAKGSATTATQPAHASAAAPLTNEQKADFRRGIEIFRSFSAAVASKEVKAPVKTRLIACLYTSKLGDISRATRTVIKNNPDLSDSKPTDVWRAAAGVCGISFKKSDAPKSAIPPATNK